MPRFRGMLLSFYVSGLSLSMAQAPVGSITGTVRDATGGFMQDVSVTVMTKDTGLARQMATSADGIFSAASLPAGSYVIKASAAGFQTLAENATVQAGQVTSADLIMTLGAASEVVSVHEEAVQLDYFSHTRAGVITRERAAARLSTGKPPDVLNGMRTREPLS